MLALSCSIPLLVSFSTFLLPSLASQCWYPDGETLAISDIPCNTESSDSACCGPNSFCMSNGLCFGNGVLSRGSCTDKSWNSTECAQFCTGTDGKIIIARSKVNEHTDKSCTDASAGAPLQPCNGDQGLFACGTSNSDCINDENTFTITGGNAILLHQSGKTEPLTVAPTSTLAAAAVASNSGPVSTLNKAKNAQFTEGDMIGVGAGVGVPLLLALIGTICVICNQRQKLHALRLTRLAEKADSDYSTPAHVQSPAPIQPQPQHSPYYPSYNFQPVPQGGPQSYFREEQVNELDSFRDPQELSSSGLRK